MLECQVPQIFVTFVSEWCRPVWGVSTSFNPPAMAAANRPRVPFFGEACHPTLWFCLLLRANQLELSPGCHIFDKYRYQPQTESGGSKDRLPQDLEEKQLMDLEALLRSTGMTCRQRAPRRVLQKLLGRAVDGAWRRWKDRERKKRLL